jgi:hypothetical protein
LKKISFGNLKKYLEINYATLEHHKNEGEKFKTFFTTIFTGKKKVKSVNILE